jgi:hypothetical protein
MVWYGRPSNKGCQEAAAFAVARKSAGDMRSEQETRELIRREILRSNLDLPEVRIRFTENSSTMASLSGRGRRSVLRLHRIFCGASDELLGEVVRFFFTRVGRQNALRIRARMKDYIERHQKEILEPLAGKRFLPPEGRVFDLKEMLRRVTERFFPTADRVRIAWSRKVLKQLMGKWIEFPDPLPNLVLINRLLDTPEVPEYYLEFLIFHELLHETIPIRRSSGRWIHHSREFRAREREFPKYREAREWERKNVDKLYRNHHRAARSPGTNGGRMVR